MMSGRSLQGVLLLLLFTYLTKAERAGMGNDRLGDWSSGEGSGVVASVSFEEMVRDAGAGSADGSLIKLRHALAVDGIVAVSGVPGLERVREQALAAAAECIPQSKVSNNYISTTLADGSRRESVGAKSLGNHLGDLGLDSKSSSSICEKFRSESFLLRAAVERAWRLVAARLDKVTDSKAALGLESRLDDDESTRYETIASVMNAGVSLEHFHVYTPKHSGSKARASPSALELHIDAGLMIAFVPALLFGAPQPGSDSGFLYQEPSGRIVTARFPQNGACVVLMVGDGFDAAFNARVGVPLRPLPHLLKLSEKNQGGRLRRAWYGRMFLAPEHILVPGDERGVSFGQVRAHQISQLGEGAHASAGCASPSMSLAVDQASGCPNSSDVFCWMVCVNETDYHGPCPSGTQPQCVRPDHSIWTPKQGHCSSCSVKCISGKPDPPIQGNGFCNGFGSSMYMNGFTSAGDPNESCLVLLVPALKLDSALKFALGTLGVFLFGVLVEAVTMIRRKFHKKYRDRRLVGGALYFFQLCGAYVAMLFTMTYSPWIFFALVMGLAVGHVLFNSAQPIPENAEPCCAAVMESSEEQQLCDSDAENSQDQRAATAAPYVPL